jgi:hypothetical protein
VHATLHDLDVARSLARLGVPLFLARLDGDGNPLCPTAWQQTAPGDLTPVNTWQPGLALCAVMGHTFDVLDVDPRHGGTESARQLRDELANAMPRIYGKAQTPSGGWHYWLAPLGLAKRTGFRPGLDYQGGKPDGQGRGFAFIPPTVRPSKIDGVPRPYRWLEPPEPPADCDFSGVALAKAIAGPGRGSQRARAHIRQAIRMSELTRPYVRAALAAELSAVASAAEGARNVQLNRSAYAVGRFVADGLVDADAAEDALADAACHAGLDYAEAARTIHSAFRARGAL